MVAKVKKDKTPSSTTTRKKTTAKKDTKAKSVAKKKKVAKKKTTEKAVEKPNSKIQKANSPNKILPYQVEKNEEYMNDEQLNHFKEILNLWKKELMEEVDHTIMEMKEAGVLADPNDRATQEETFNLELRTRDRERKLIKKIEDALQKIEDKDYGYCEACGVEIGIRRLEARPTATLCIDCKTLAEIKEKRA